MTISEKFTDVAGKYRVRVTFDDGSSTLFKFSETVSDATVLECAATYLANTVVPTIDKSDSLRRAEDNFVLFCRSLGLPDKASSGDFEMLCQEMKSNGQTLEAFEVGLKALSLINDVTQNGGTWSNIEYHGVTQ